MRFIHQPGSSPLAGYTIQRGIHRGGFGEVYYARSDGGKEVALKLLQHDQEVELRGIQQCLNLKHPNLVSLFDVRTDDAGGQWVVMEYVNGASLEDVLAAFPSGLPVDEVRAWLDGITAGVGFLHDRGIVHRDLKPANVYRENGTVKVGDVGLSKRLGSDRRGTHTQSVGTVYYMAPEVARGEYGPEVDVYSLGVMFYEMLTGQVPFVGETAAEVLMKHLTAVPNLGRLPESIRPVVARALEKDPQRRTASVMELQQEFAAALTNNGSTTATRTRQNGATGFANGTLAGAPGVTLTETHSIAGTRGGVDTATSVPVAISRPIRTHSPFQAASAYAQYPPDVKTEAPSAKPAAVRPPVPPAKPKSATGCSARRMQPEHSGFWPLMAASAIGLWLFSPGSWASWSGLVLVTAAYVAASTMRGKRIDFRTAEPSNPSQAAGPASHPEAPRFKESVTEAGTSLALGSACASLLSVGGLLSMEFIQRTPQFPSADFTAMFAATSILASWLVLLTGQLVRPGNWFEKNPRKTFLVSGILIGSAAFFLDQFLLVDFSNQTFGYSPAYRNIGVHSLIEQDVNPTWLGYVVFFGGLMFLHRWGRDMSPRRSQRLTLGRIVTAGIAAWLMTIMFAFPQWPAILWAVVISAAVQLSSSWSPRQQRTLAPRN